MIRASRYPFEPPLLCLSVAMRRSWGGGKGLFQFTWLSRSESITEGSQNRNWSRNHRRVLLADCFPWFSQLLFCWAQGHLPRAWHHPSERDPSTSNQGNAPQTSSLDPGCFSTELPSAQLKKTSSAWNWKQKLFEICGYFRIKVAVLGLMLLGGKLSNWNKDVT